MSISVYEALNLPGMVNTTLIAGHEGVHNIIKWVTTVEVIEDINRLQEGEFLVTTGYGLNENSQEFERLLAMKKLSGVAIYTGFYLDRIPKAFIEIANENKLPLIELPTEINFSNITKSILEEILNKQMEMISLSLDSHKQLTQLVLKNDGENRISTTLSNLTGASIFVMNHENELSYHVIKHDSLLHMDSYLMTDQDSLFYKNLSVKCQSEKRPIQKEWDDFKVLFYPIVANEKNYGCLIALKELEEWREIHWSIIEHAATVYAIEYLKEEAVFQTQMRLKGEFLEELINKNFQSSSMALERGKKLGFDLSINQAVLYVKNSDFQGSTDSKTDIATLYQQIQQAMERQGRQFIVRERLEGLIILAEVKTENQKQDSLDIAYALLEQWKEKKTDIPIIIGIGKTYSDVNQLSQSAVEAEYAADLSHLLLTEKEILHYDDLGTFHLLLQMKELGLSLQQFYSEHIGELLKKSKQGIDLIHTLEVFFKNNQNLQTTSADLFIHRHTLKYRLNLVEKRSGYDLNSADDRLKLQLAIAAYKLEQYYQS